MAPHHEEFHGIVNLSNILNGANKEMKDLPLLEGFIDNNERITLYLNWCLGVYSYVMRDRCRFIRGNVPKDNILNKFATKLCHVLALALQHVLMHGSSGLGPLY